LECQKLLVLDPPKLGRELGKAKSKTLFVLQTSAQKFGTPRVFCSWPSQVHDQTLNRQEQEAFDAQKLNHELGRVERIFLLPFQTSTPKFGALKALKKF
jgi:hypothetical protein